MREKISRVVLLALAALLVVPALGGVAEAKKKKPSVPVKVMTRNIFLGADLSPALNSANFHAFIEANGAILREVDQTNFPLRAQGLAQEIKSKKPDLIGLQEAALWRVGDAAIAPAVPGPPVATTVKYDFLQLLVDELKKRGLDYKVAVVKEEFDFEAPADYNNVEDDGPLPAEGNPNDDSPNDLNDAEMNGRLTMRDAILVNKDSKVKAKLKDPRTGTFQNIYAPTVSGIKIPVTRGWTAGDVTVQKGEGKKKVTKKFTFVNTHFEAFDDETQRPSIRALQAQELTSGGGAYAEGPASPKKVILLGDFNSNVPGVQPGDEQAFQTLLDAGFSRRSTANPLSCCVSNLFTSPASEFDHQVDHIMTNQSKKKVKLVDSSVTGLAQVNGIYNSDHAGVVSTLKLK